MPYMSTSQNIKWLNVDDVTKSKLNSISFIWSPKAKSDWNITVLIYILFWVYRGI